MKRLVSGPRASGAGVTVTVMDLDWNAELVRQLEGHWGYQLRPRLDGLTDEEFLWEPVPGCWSVRPRGAGTAAQALRQLDDAYAAWIAGVRGLDAEALGRPCGPAEGPFAEYPMATLVLHINREVIHHGAEISLLRDLYLHQK
jgi:hypothetical protein